MLIAYLYRFILTEQFPVSFSYVRIMHDNAMDMHGYDLIRGYDFPYDKPLVAWIRLLDLSKEPIIYDTIQM